MKFRSVVALLREEKVNFNKATKEWQVRSDAAHHGHIKDVKKVVLKDAKPHVDHDAFDSGKKLYAYQQGKVVSHDPDEKTHSSHPLKFNPGNSEHPFVHSDTGKPVHHADYVVFDHRGATAYHKK